MLLGAVFTILPWSRAYGDAKGVIRRLKKVSRVNIRLNLVSTLPGL